MLTRRIVALAIGCFAITVVVVGMWFAIAPDSAPPPRSAASAPAAARVGPDGGDPSNGPVKLEPEPATPPGATGAAPPRPLGVHDDPDGGYAHDVHDDMHTHDEPPREIVAGRGPDTPLEQLAVERLLADATGQGRDEWPDLDSPPCCPDSTIDVAGVTTLADSDTTTVVIAWTADGISRSTTSRWAQTGPSWKVAS